MAYEAVYAITVRAVQSGPEDPDNPYANIHFIQDGEPLAHAAAPPQRVPECGATRFIVPGELWSAPIPARYRRCPECVGAHPLE
ncbi:hypothetical protein [Actinomadura sp. 6N118]|uniref:hypothetical protein n=1 Tax=Actinomadura sp. 6N118 TaxID=3375151 RepID=UPI0037B5E449